MFFKIILQSFCGVQIYSRILKLYSLQIVTTEKPELSGVRLILFMLCFVLLSRSSSGFKVTLTLESLTAAEAFILESFHLYNSLIKASQ